MGLSAEQIVGRSIIDVIGSKAFEVIRPYVERVLRGERVEYEEEVPISAGGPRFFHLLYEPWFDSASHVTGWIASISEITALKRTTKALLESEERLRLAMSSGTIGVWDWDVASGQATWSPELCEIFGVDAEKARSYGDFSSRVHPDDLAAVESGRDTAVRNHEQFDLEFRIIRPSGEIRWLAGRGRGHYDKNGTVVRVVGNNIDITERVQAKEALREREQRLRLALDGSAAGIWTLDVRNNQLDWDDRTYAHFGYAPGTAQPYRLWLACAHPEDRPRLLARLDQMDHTRGDDDWNVTTRIVRPDGTQRWLQGLGRAERDSDGRITRLMGISLDITENRRVEEVLREREQTLRLALDASGAGAWTWDPFTNQSRWDDRFHAQYGFGEGALQTFDTWISSVHEEDRPKVLAHLDDVLHRHQNEWNIVFRAVRPDGSVRWMHGLGRADRATDGQVTKMSGINLDITERRRAEEVLQARRDEERDRALHRQAEEALRRSHAELEQRTLQLSRLASQLTLAEQHAREQLARTLHDGLQQQLFTAALALDRAAKSGSQADQQDMLQKARAEINEAVEAARTLSVNLFPPILHVGGLPAALSWLAKRTQEQYGVVVSVTADPQANPTARDTRILLFEAVRELLFNAVKHARVDRVDVSLAAGTDGTIEIQVSDEGVGFDPAVTLHQGDQHELGLGLFSIQERLALLGGQLDIQSAPGKGTRFSLTLPRTALSRSATDGKETQRRDTIGQDRSVYDSASGTAKPLRILIVDDQAVVRAGLCELLGARLEFHIVGEAVNGVEAISEAKVRQPDVIVIDVSMPQMNGIDATREIHSTLPHIQIVALSTYGDESTEHAVRQAGAQAFFSKTESTHRLLDYLLSLVPQAKTASAD
jgi:PAS domain S-box-containing protein